LAGGGAMKPEFNHDPKTLGDWAYIAIDQHFHKILKHEMGVLKDEEPEELHQMRVGMRRLRSALTGFSPALKMPKWANQKQVGRIASILGKLRDLDVLKESLSDHYKPILPHKEQKLLTKALEVLGNQREEIFRQVHSLLEDSIYFNLKKAFQEWLERPQYHAFGYISIETVLPDLLLPQVSNFLLHKSWLIGAKTENNKLELAINLTSLEVEALLARKGAILHDLRKEAKRSRYNMELFTQFYGDKYKEYLQEIKDIQGILGEIQDCCVLSDFLNSIFKASLQEEMPTLIETFQSIRYQKWQEWQPLQVKFLDARNRKELHTTISNPFF
jgi:CHAD domain-containing protein